MGEPGVRGQVCLNALTPFQAPVAYHHDLGCFYFTRMDLESLGLNGFQRLPGLDLKRGAAALKEEAELPGAALLTWFSQLAIT